MLDDFALPAYDIQAVYPQQRYLPATIRHARDYFGKRYQTPGSWEAGPAA